MKKLLLILPLAFLLCVLLIESKPIHAKEWTPEQKEIVDWFKKYTEVSIEGNLKEIFGYFHTKFSGWAFSQTSQTAPYDKTFLQNFLEKFNKAKNKTISFEAEPLEIKVEGNIAIIHANYKEKFKDSEGNEITMSGPWNSALIKQDGKWLFICWVGLLRS